jgi:hypothetical protein
MVNHECSTYRTAKKPTAEEPEVVEISDVDTLEAPILDAFEPEAQPEELASTLQSFYLSDIKDFEDNPPASFTELLLSEKIFVMHEQFDPKFQSVYVPQVAPSTLGDLSGSVEKFDASALVASMFPSS